ncbi:PIN domain-containing protein [Nonomuraea glycinis]|uniref:Ribonuclease VapC n=1 Tax=Nonomuraea glycinis TaxID=2047744 RepID=A0A918E3E4_9ACTN|nr:PIN domain-containing protein [Nonomuraea glycinis]MCA2175509.1 PIN domain-containing protein [Nonomuraea glycinis]GGP04818.1 ribonuclease VapC [Nonomuraea glycinis]
MLVLDTSGAFAAIDGAAEEHQAARRVLENERGPILLSPFVLAELDYMLLTRISLRAELSYLQEVADGVYDLMPMTRHEIVETVDIVERYADMKVGVADASIAVLAARYRTTRVLTLDQRHFRAMKPLWGDAFTVLPADAA